jgi:hypothetical protein
MMRLLSSICVSFLTLTLILKRRTSPQPSLLFPAPRDMILCLL